jgi:cytoskeletal protein CcmA (bactofilin family)
MAASTVIGPETQVQGPLTAGDEDVIIEGSIAGPVTGRATVTVGRRARVAGEVRGRDVIVAGSLTHNIHATASIRLMATADVRGDLYAPRVAIDDGAGFEGKIKMARSAAPQEHPAGPAAPAPAAPLASQASHARSATPSPGKPPTAPPAVIDVAASSTPAARAIPELSVPGRRRLHRRSPAGHGGGTR